MTLEALEPQVHRRCCSLSAASWVDIGGAMLAPHPSATPKETRASNLVQTSCPYCGGCTLASGAGASSVAADFRLVSDPN